MMLHEISEDPAKLSSAPIQPLKCAVITPIGPGHEELAQKAKASVVAAFRAHRGPFADVLFFPLNDLTGEHGRSKRRNDGIDSALAHKIDWIFFLDADDRMVEDAFASVAPYIQDHDAIFGMIAESSIDKPDQVSLRPNQLGATESLKEILRYAPALSIQMGHFVRTKAAAAIRFDSQMNAGEDFKYYLELWKQFRCAKIDRPLFINYRGTHSTGPRSANDTDWRSAVNRVFEDFCSRNKYQISFPWEGKIVHFVLGNSRDLIHQHFMACRFFEAEELTYLRGVVPPLSTIIEVGANIGNHLVYYGLFMQPKKIIPIEPTPKAIDLLKKNIQLNQISTVDTSLLGFGVGDKYGHFDIHMEDDSNFGTARLLESDNGCIEVYPLDEKLNCKFEFIKIDVEWMEMEALRGATRLIEANQPIIFIEIMNANIDAFLQWVESQNYRVLKIFPYINAKNYVVVPASSPLCAQLPG